MEGANSEIASPYVQPISQKLCQIMKEGISISKENAATALASTIEQAGEAFKPFFTETLGYLVGLLDEFYDPVYKQFRGQVIEAITIISAAVGEEAFLPVAGDVIKVMINI